MSPTKAWVWSCIHPFTNDGPHAHLCLPTRAVTSTQLSQQQAAVLLGYTQVSWDNASGREVQPGSASKQWTDLTTVEKSAATVLDYTEQTWSTFSATKKAPWSDLAVTIGAEVLFVVYCLFNNHCRVASVTGKLVCKHVAT